MARCAAELLSSWPGRGAPVPGYHACSAPMAATFSHPAAQSAASQGTVAGGTPPFISRFIRGGVQGGERTLSRGLRQALEKSLPELSRRGRGAGQRGFANKMFGFFARCVLSGHFAPALGSRGHAAPGPRVALPGPAVAPRDSAFHHGRLWQPQRRDL